MDKRWSVLVLVVLLLAGVPSGEAAADGAPSGDVVLAEMESVRFLKGDESFGRIWLKPYTDPELAIVAGPAAGPERRAVSWWEAEAYDGRSTGIWMASNRDEFPGGISIYVNNETRVFVTEEGLMIRDAHRLNFGDEWHYLAVCGDDLCWHSPAGVVNLSSGE